MLKTTFASLLLIAILAAGVLALTPSSSSAADFGNDPVKPCPASDPAC